MASTPHGLIATFESTPDLYHAAEQVRDAGLDAISVGALTHSVRALDLSLKIGALPPAFRSGGSK